MLMSFYANDASICLRCQHRLLSRNRLRKKRRNLLSPKTFPRSFTFFDSLRQVQTESKEKVAHTGGLSMLRRTRKSTHFHSKDSLEVGALGNPSKIIRMGELQPKMTDTTSDKLEATNDGHNIMGPLKILATIDEERGLINARRIVINIDRIKSSWFARLQNRSGVPTVSEYNDIAKALWEGFTRNQLRQYLEDQDTYVSKPLSSTELFTPYSTDLYTRSSWRPKSTAFPGNALSELVAQRERLKDENTTQPKNTKELQGAQEHFGHSGTKSLLIDRILCEQWNLRTDQEREKAGEVDILMHQEHLSLILNHRSNMLKGLAQKYGVKVDAALSHGIIRISGDIGTCGDIFRFLIYTLENINSVDIGLSSEQSQHEQNLDQGQRFLNHSFRRQIEQLTSTVLKPMPRSKASAKTHEKLRVYYLGPSQDDLEDVQRILSQKYRPVASQHDFALWESAHDLSQLEPCPIEIEQGLPLVERGTQWSRWTAGLSQGFNAWEGSNNQPCVNSDRWYDVLKSISDLLFMDAQIPTTMIDSNKHTNTFWGDGLMRETSAVFGQVLYPSDSIKKTKQAVSANQGRGRDSAFCGALASRREFLSTFAGLRVLVSSDLEGIQKDNPGWKSYQDLCIRLVPSQNGDVPIGGKCILPDLELRLDINQQTKETALVGVRLISDRRKVDLLLPEEIADVRFLAKSYVPAALHRIDPQMSDFIKSSNLNIFGQGRLKTPTTLSVLIPRCSVQDISQLTLSDGIRVLDPGPDIPVNYTFSSLEHRSYLSKQVGQSELEYVMIEAGKIGGRRIEARLKLRNFSKPNEQNEFLNCFQNVHRFFERFRESTSLIAPKDVVSDLDPSFPTRPQPKYNGNGLGPRVSKYLNPELFSETDQNPIARKIRALPNLSAEVNQVFQAGGRVSMRGEGAKEVANAARHGGGGYGDRGSES